MFLLYFEISSKACHLQLGASSFMCRLSSKALSQLQCSSVLGCYLDPLGTRSMDLEFCVMSIRLLQNKAVKASFLFVFAKDNLHLQKPELFVRCELNTVPKQWPLSLYYLTWGPKMHNIVCVVKKWHCYHNPEHNFHVFSVFYQVTLVSLAFKMTLTSVA